MLFWDTNSRNKSAQFDIDFNNSPRDCLRIIIKSKEKLLWKEVSNYKILIFSNYELDIILSKY